MRARARRAAGFRLAVLVLGCAVCSGVCLRLCAGQDTGGLWRRVGLLGFTFAADPQAAGRTLAQWLTADVSGEMPQTDVAEPPAQQVQALQPQEETLDGQAATPLRRSLPHRRTAAGSRTDGCRYGRSPTRIPVTGSGISRFLQAASVI